MTTRDRLTFYAVGVGDDVEHRWTVEAPNYEITLASTQGYNSREDAEANARRYFVLEPTTFTDVFEVLSIEEVQTAAVLEAVDKVSADLTRLPLGGRNTRAWWALKQLLLTRERA